MAITNAQQFKQLVNPPMDGKRPGYRGPGGYQSGKSDPAKGEVSSDSGFRDSGNTGVGRQDTESQYGSGSVGMYDSSQNVSDRGTGFTYGVNAPTPVRFSSGPPKESIAERAMRRRKLMGAKLMKEKIPGTQEYLDAEDDDTAAELDLFINDPMTKESFLPLTLKPFEQPLKKGAVKTRKFFTGPTTDLFGRKQTGVLQAGNFNYKGGPLTEERFNNMSLTEKNKAYKSYMDQRMSNEIDAYGNPLNTGDDRGQTLPIIPRTIANMTDDAADDDADEKENVGRMFRLLADGGMTEDAPVGGIMDIETGRQMYGLGKLVKKATRAVKKIVKSPIGKAALIGGLGYLGAQTGFGSKLLADFKNLSALKQAGVIGGGLLAAAPFFMKQEEDDEEDIDRGPGLDIANIRANPYTFIPRRFAAEGGSMKEPVAKKTMPLIDMDGKEKDYRETGGFVDMGRMERADDVPARLSKNEFVFTADAVRNAGDGSVDKGAEVMYNMMKNLEAGGDVSEESQGLDGARKMFQTSQRLGEVL